MSLLRHEHLCVLNFIVPWHGIRDDFLLVTADSAINQHQVLLVLTTLLADDLIFSVAH
jgi:hypothetical protein